MYIHSRLALAFVMLFLSVGTLISRHKDAALPEPKAVTATVAAAEGTSPDAPHNVPVRHVMIRNNDSSTIEAIFASDPDSNEWGQDFLGEHEVLHSHKKRVIDITDGNDSCFYDFKAEFENGDVVVFTNINICDYPVFGIIDGLYA